MMAVQMSELRRQNLVLSEQMAHQAQLISDLHRTNAAMGEQNAALNKQVSMRALHRSACWSSMLRAWYVTRLRRFRTIIRRSSTSICYNLVTIRYQDLPNAQTIAPLDRSAIRLPSRAARPPTNVVWMSRWPRPIKPKIARVASAKKCSDAL